jgi:hypothetical protein
MTAAFINNDYYYFELIATQSVRFLTKISRTRSDMLDLAFS